MSQQQRSQPDNVFLVAGDQVAHAEREDVLTRHDTSDDGLSVSETVLPWKRVITASSRGQFAVPAPASERADLSGGAVTIDEALEVAAVVSRSDAAAIQAAEARAMGLGSTVPGGVTAKAQAAAESNTRAVNDDQTVKLSDVLTDATVRLPKDKLVTEEDAERVKAAEKRNSPDDQEEQVGVAGAAASRMNPTGTV